MRTTQRPGEPMKRGCLMKKWNDSSSLSLFVSAPFFRAWVQSRFSSPGSKVFIRSQTSSPPAPTAGNTLRVGGARVSILSLTSQREERVKISPLSCRKRRRTGHRPAAHRHNNRGSPVESPEHSRAALQSAGAALRLPHRPGALSALRCNHVRLTAPTGPPPLI